MAEQFTTTSGRTRYSGAMQVGTSSPIIIPALGRSLGVALIPTDGTSRVEYTLGSVKDITSGKAVWQQWPKGDVTSYADDLMIVPATAIRCVVTSGSALLHMVL